MSDDTEKTGELYSHLNHLAKQLALSLVATPANSSGVCLMQEAVKASGRAALAFKRACKARSRSDFTAALPEVGNLLEETLYWLTLAVESGVVSGELSRELPDLARDCASRITLAMREPSSSSSSGKSSSSSSSSSRQRSSGSRSSSFTDKLLRRKS